MWSPERLGQRNRGRGRTVAVNSRGPSIAAKWPPRSRNAPLGAAIFALCSPYRVGNDDVLSEGGDADGVRPEPGRQASPRSDASSLSSIAADMHRIDHRDVDVCRRHDAGADQPAQLDVARTGSGVSIQPQWRPVHPPMTSSLAPRGPSPRLRSRSRWQGRMIRSDLERGTDPVVEARWYAPDASLDFRDRRPRVARPLPTG